MTTTLDWPEALRPASVEWRLVVPQLVGRSAFDGSVQADSMGAAYWAFAITTGALKRSEVPEWEAFIQRLRGAVNRVRAWDWRRELPLGPASGAPEVFVSALGASLQVQGWLPNIAGVLQAGSYIGINGELKRLSVTANSDALGRGVIQFEPPMRVAPPVATPLILAKPTARFVLVGDTPSWEQRGGRVPSQSLKFVEDLRP